MSDEKTPEDSHQIGLTMETIEQISERANLLSKERTTRTETLTKLGQQIKPLWDLLEVEEDYRSQFFAENTGLGMRIIDRCEQELSSLAAQKKNKLKEITLSLRKQISELWDKLSYGDAQKREVDSFTLSENYTEVLFDKHEEYLAVSRRLECLLFP